MHSSCSLMALAATFSTTLAAFQGFNYGSTFNNGAAKVQSDFEAEFKTAQGLVGAPGGGFTSARLYTTVQAGTSNQPIAAIPAAIATKTSLLLGIWCSAGDGIVDNELAALRSAITKYGADFGSLVAGISVGSEDLYRNSPTGILNKENPGKDPADIVRYIKLVRDAIAGTPLANAPVGHVDTWTAWVNGSNQAVIDASDWLGVDAYPYFQDTQTNTIENSKDLFNAAFDATKAAAGGKPVWVTETGYPVSGKTVGLAVPSLQNAKTYWDQVGCPLFGSTNIWWYTLQDAAPATPNPSFGIIGSSLTTTPLYDISCNNVNPPPPSSTSASSSSSSTPSSSSSQVSSSSTKEPAGSITSSGPSSSLVSSTLPTTLVTDTTVVQPTPTGNVVSGSGSGSNGGVTTTGTSSPSAATGTHPNGGAVASGSMSAAFAAVMVAILVL